MQIIVIGASGLIGGHVFQKCQDRLIPVVGTSTSGTEKKLIRWRLGIDEPELLAGYIDSNSPEPACAVITAAIANIAQCEKEPKETRRINVVHTIELIEYLSGRGVRCVFLSSDAVFDGKKGNYTEDDATMPLNEYGRQKKEVEDYLLSHIENVLIFRLSKQYDLNNRRRHLFSDIYTSAIEKKSVIAVKGLRFNPTYVGDTADCIIEGCARGLKGLYNVAAPEQLLRYDVSMRLLHALGMDASIVEQIAISDLEFVGELPLDTTMSTFKLQKDISRSFMPVETAVRKFRGKVIK